ncbi:MAG: beta-ketoacyl synthase [SAR86 cluster bacterium]|uniref:Beta-ketoacyl synthase n=1 Tax=SAR86 cluster bacterium TaxID=2030880 RepID=A0A2A5B3F7_9GAMM|nr:MAG: beta-ketoacyl synthase [SAR86 cluster bacterium]
MARLPVIAGFGGINAAGRSSGHHAYRRMVIDALAPAQVQQTYHSLAALTGRLSKQSGNWIDAAGDTVELDSYIRQISESLDQGTLIRRLEQNLFDPAELLYHKKAKLTPASDDSLHFEIRRKDLPSPVPPGWVVTETGPDKKDKLSVRVTDSFEVMFKCTRKAAVNSAGQLPTGFDPALLYPARNHPRGLQLTVFAASDAINSLGIDWEVLRQKVAPDQISVYAGSGMSQLDYNGYGGMMQARLIGKKVTSKQLPLGYAEMPADFINAYLLGNLGTTGTNVAACATFLYNLRQGISDIQSGTHRVVIVGTSEAPLVPEIFDGFATMGALADDASLRELDNLKSDQDPDFRRACRPFGNNAGFTLAESAQCIILFDDELALELGANIYGGINEVFINADGYKKSIASPGLGNYISMAKAAAATRNIIGDEGLRQRSFVQAHGTGTLQNRQTESQILNRVAEAFSIQDWPITAIKSYIGHSLASSAGDQLAASLGIWSDGIIPGILTVDEIAEDVHQQKTDFLMQHKEVGSEGMDAVIINSKGFGGNNASASILAPHIVEKMLLKRHGSKALSNYKTVNESVKENTAAYDCAAMEGDNQTIYRFDHNVLGDDSIEIGESNISVDGVSPKISLQIDNSYEDMCDE